MMNRRNFLKLGAMTLAGAAVPKYSSAEQLKYPLTSVPDKGTNLDESKAAKARKLAEYVITTTPDIHPGLIYYNPNKIGETKDYQGVEAVMIVDGKRYTVWVGNVDERVAKRPDFMSFWIRPDGTHSNNKLIVLGDEGLDGRCDFGVDFGSGGTEVSRNLNAINFANRPKTQEGVRGLEHKDRFQSLYNGTLDTLIKFYERSK